MRDFEALISAAASAVRKQGLNWYEKRSPPASAEAISQCEAVLGVRLPLSYIDLLRQHNGLMLLIERSQYVEYFIKLLGTHEVVERTRQVKRSMAKDFPDQPFDGLIVFANVMDGDLCLFDRTQAVGEVVPVLAADHEDDPRGWRGEKLTDDFTTWFTNVLRFVIEWPEHNEFRYWWFPEWSPERTG